MCLNSKMSVLKVKLPDSFGNHLVTGYPPCFSCLMVLTYSLDERDYAYFTDLELFDPAECLLRVRMWRHLGRLQWVGAIHKPGNLPALSI